MRNITPEFKQELLNGNRAYICRVETDIEIGTSSETLTFTNTELWTGGLIIKDDISPSESSFEALGSVCIGAVTIIINNIDEDYTEIDFKGATIVPYVGLEINSTIESIKLGTYNVEEVTYSGALITLYCIDSLSKFDKSIPSSLSGTMTLGTIVATVCSACGVILDTPTFSNYTYTITIPNENEATTCREVLSYCATIAGCFVKCTANGHIKLDWFDKTALATAQTAIENETYDGNVTGVHYFESLSSQELGIDDVVITGIQITVTDPDEEATESVITRTYGTTDYVIKIEDNPFITASNIDTIGAYLQNQLTGLKFRHGSISTLNSPAIEAGDVAIVKDRKGKYYSILITNTEFSINSYQTITSAADTPARNLGSRFSSLTKSFVEAKNMVKQEATQRETLEQELTQAINAKAGMYETRVQEAGGGYTYYMHDKPNLSDSSAVIKITNEAVAVTPNYQASPIQWYGLTVDGTFIANIMDTIGINFDWGTGGTLTLGGQNNQNGILTVLDTNSNIIGVWNNLGIRLYNADGSLTGQFAYGTNFETQIGKTDTSHIYMDYHSMQLVDKEGITYFYISDLRGLDGKFALTESLIVDDDSETTYHVALLPVEATVTVNGVIVTNYTRNGRDFHFSAPFTIGDTVVFDYTTESQYAKGYTLGLRESGHAIGSLSITEGYLGYASGFAAHSEGYKTSAQGDSAHAEGNNTIAKGHRSHAEGYNTQTTINSYGAHAEGGYTIASANYAHSEGWHTTASDKNAHAEGYYTTASGFASHVGGENSVTSKNSSFAHGLYLLASSNYQTVFGKYNIEDSNDTYAVIVGNGTADDARSNALTVDWSGNVKANDFKTAGASMGNTSLSGIADGTVTGAVGALNSKMTPTEELISYTYGGKTANFYFRGNGAGELCILCTKQDSSMALPTSWTTIGYLTKFKPPSDRYVSFIAANGLTGTFRIWADGAVSLNAHSSGNYWLQFSAMVYYK